MEDIFHFFHIFPFGIGVLIGILYIATGGRGQHEVIYKYPHPDTVNALVYRDPNKACYRYTATKVDCDANQSALKEYPLSG
jgi:hypothetical protein